MVGGVVARALLPVTVHPRLGDAEPARVLLEAHAEDLAVRPAAAETQPRLLVDDEPLVLHRRGDVAVPHALDLLLAEDRRHAPARAR